MLTKTFEDAKQLHPRWGGILCPALFILSWGFLALGAKALEKENTYLLFEKSFKKEPAQETAPSEANASENPTLEIFPPLLPPSSLEELQKRSREASQKVSKLQATLRLPRNSKLEFILGHSVKEGLLHPLEASQIQKEYEVLASTKPSRTP